MPPALYSWELETVCKKHLKSFLLDTEALKRKTLDYLCFHLTMKYYQQKALDCVLGGITAPQLLSVARYNIICHLLAMYIH